MVTHSRTLAWKIPWTEEPGRLQSMGSLRVRLSNFTFTLPCYLYNKFQPLNENMHSSNPSFRLVSYKLFSNSTSKNPIFQAPKISNTVMSQLCSPVPLGLCSCYSLSEILFPLFQPCGIHLSFKAQLELYLLSEVLLLPTPTPPPWPGSITPSKSLCSHPDHRNYYKIFHHFLCFEAWLYSPLTFKKAGCNQFYVLILNMNTEMSM